MRIPRCKPQALLSMPRKIHEGDIAWTEFWRMNQPPLLCRKRKGFPGRGPSKYKVMSLRKEHVQLGIWTPDHSECEAQGSWNTDDQEWDETEHHSSCLATFISCLGNRELFKNLDREILSYLCFLKTPEAIGAVKE